ncbi:MAG: ribonuclease Z [Syntrophorhabdaceae bacterium]|nr:ribonuclease Z [Syntrophorhabdaceae bacterium]
MKIKILGTGTSIPTLTRLSSSYLVITKGKHILVDIGPSVVRRLLEFGYAVNDIDAVLLTHFHVDHTADLSTLLFACNYGIEPRYKPLLLLGGLGLKRFFKTMASIYPWIKPNYYELILKTLSHGEYFYDNILIKTIRVNHNRESIAIKITDRKSVVFSGDTSFSKNLIKLAHNTDLLIAECSFPERVVKGHLNLKSLQKIIEKAKPKKVILSHLYPDWDAYRGVLNEPCLIGEDGMELEI